MIALGFSGPIQTCWLVGHPRKMYLLNTTTFTDACGLVWTASKGRVVIGASIPRFLWTAIGSPYVGSYRRAAVFHDVYCTTQEHSTKETNVMFMEAMLTDGVPRFQAWMFYRAVCSMGPKWSTAI